MSSIPHELAPRALAFAVRCHSGQFRTSDGAPFIQHPLEVARLLRDAGCSEAAVAAGLLHDVVENTHVDLAEIAHRFGDDVAALVGAVTDHSCIESYRERKQVLRDNVQFVGGEVALLFAADKISKVREWPKHRRREQEQLEALPRDSRACRYLAQHHAMRHEHYRKSLTMLQRVAPEHPLVAQLAEELEHCAAPDRAPLL